MAQEARRRAASEQVERELTALFRRIRSFSFAVAEDVHPGLEPASYGMMGVIHDAGSMRGSDIVERLGLDKSTISRQVAQLVELGLAERVPDPDDGRARRVQLTERGVSELMTLRRERHRRLQVHFADWSDDDLEQVAGWLSRLAAAL